MVVFLAGCYWTYKKFNSDNIKAEIREMLKFVESQYYFTDLLKLKRYADKIVVINQGEIAEQGTHDELLQIENGAYKTLYDMQFKKQEVEA